MQKTDATTISNLERNEVLNTSKPVPISFRHLCILALNSIDPQKNLLEIFSRICKTVLGSTKRDIKYKGRLVSTLLRRTSLPSFDRYLNFHPARCLSIFSITGFHIDVALYFAPMGKPKYVEGSSFVLARLKNVIVLDHIMHADGVVSWNLHLRRPLNDWEMMEASNLMFILEVYRVGSLDEDDSSYWLFDNAGMFSVSSCFEVLRPHGPGAIPFKVIWMPSLPSKVRFILWLALWNRALSTNNLKV